MDNNQYQSSSAINDHTSNIDDHKSLYLTLFQADLTHTTIKWTVTSFFMGISFALLGFSFQANLSFTSALAIRISALAIYWFAYILYLHYYSYNVFLRNYLKEMEVSSRVIFDVQRKTQDLLSKRSKIPRVKRLLFFFGLIYCFGVTLLFIIKL